MEKEKLNQIHPWFITYLYYFNTPLMHHETIMISQIYKKDNYKNVYWLGTEKASKDYTEKQFLKMIKLKAFW
jgi:hypothetical protein